MRVKQANANGALNSTNTTYRDMSRVCDIYAEMAVLGAMMIGGSKAALRGTELLSEGAFYREANQKIFAAMQRLAAGGTEVDIVTVKDTLERDGTLKDCGDVAYLMQLHDVDFTTANLPHYAKILRERQGIRGVWEYCTDLAESALNSQLSSDALIAQMQDSALKLSDYGGSRDTARSAHEVVSDLVDSMLNTSRTRLPVILGVREVDCLLGPLQKGEMTILGARPGVGKSHMAMQYAYNAAKRGIKTVFVSCEMTAKQLVMRLACRLSKINSQHLRTVGFDNLSDFDKKKFTDALRRIAALPLIIIDQRRETLTATRIASLLRQKSLEGACEFACVDYLQRVRPEEERRFDSREQEVAFVSHTLASIALSLDIPLLVVAQINRQGSHDPSMEDLRESGAIEADAHNIVLLHPEEGAMLQNGFSRLKIKVEKQREGDTGVTSVLYQKIGGIFTGEHQA